MKLLQVVGIGPGCAEQMTFEAHSALQKSEVIVGYKTYIDLIKAEFPDKEYVENGMRQEKDRCRRALEIANENHIVSVISSGDAGVYGMSGLILELSQEYPEVEVQVIAGVTAALSGGAVLGAPLGHDFAVISLSDLLTPMEKIEKRVRLAGEADLCICFYNPGSHKRKDHLRKMCDILMESRSKDTICGYVRNIGRDEGDACIMTLEEIRELDADMLTTVFIGNSETKIVSHRMVTPRGYRK